MSRESVKEAILLRRSQSPSMRTSDDASMSREKLKEQILAKRRTEQEKAIMKQPSIMRRMYGAAAFPNEQKRKAYMLDKGFDPEYDRPLGSGGLREFGADMAESVVPGGLKTGGLLAGGKIGALVGGVPGAILGAGAGTAAAQQLFEDTAQNIDRVRAIAKRTPGLQESDFALAPDIYEEEGRLGRAGMEFATGAAAQTLGYGVKGAAKLLGKGGKAIAQTKVARTLGEAMKKGKDAVESYMLTNVSTMTKPMQEWAKHNWSRLYHLAKDNKLIQKLDNRVQKLFFEPLAKAKTTLGRHVGEAKRDVMTHLGEVDLAGVGDDAKNIVTRYVGNVTSTEGNAAAQIARNLERLNRVARTFAAGVPAKGKIKGIESFQKRVTQAYIEQLDKLIQMGRATSAGMKGRDPSALTSMISEVKKAIFTKYGLTSNQAPAFQRYSDLAGLMDDVSKYIGDDKAQMLNNIAKSVLADDNTANYHTKQALDNIVKNAGRLGIDIGESTMNRMKDYVTALWMGQGKILTAGVKTFLPSTVASAAGGLVGGRKGATIGGGIGLALTAPYMTPKSAALMYSTLESIGRIGSKAASSYITKAVPVIAARAKLAGKPIETAIEGIRRKFMGEDTETEEQY
jgi:hypothetical protein